MTKEFFLKFFLITIFIAIYLLWVIFICLEIAEVSDDGLFIGSILFLGFTHLIILQKED